MLCLHCNFQRLVFVLVEKSAEQSYTHTQTHDNYRMSLGLNQLRHKYLFICYRRVCIPNADITNETFSQSSPLTPDTCMKQYNYRISQTHIIVENAYRGSKVDSVG